LNIYRTLVSRALADGDIATLLSHGIGAEHFPATSEGQEIASVYDWACVHSRRYDESPSMQLVKERWPQWRAEGTSDSLPALIESFLGHIKRRAFSAKVRELAELEQDPSKWSTLDESLLDAARDLSALFPSGRVGKFAEGMAARIENYDLEKRTGISQGILMGIPEFDDMTNGMQPGNIVTVSGFSGRGKSLLSGWFLMNALEQEANGLLITLEMSESEVMERFDTMVMNFSHRMLCQRDLPESDYSKWRSVARQYASMKTDLTVIDDIYGCTVDRVYAEINRHKPDITVVDFIQLMKVTRRSDKRWEALVDIVNELKAIARSTGTVIVVVSQDGKGSANDGSTETNGGGSVAIFQASNIYIGLHQDEALAEQDRIEVRLLKNRRGETRKTANLIWKPSNMDIRPAEGPVPTATEFSRSA